MARAGQRHRGAGKPTVALPPAAWKLALQQHTRSSSKISSLISSPAGTFRSERSQSLDIDFEESQYAERSALRSSQAWDATSGSDLLLIRELAENLLDRVSKDKRQAQDGAGRGGALEAAENQASKRRPDDVDVSEAMISEAPTTNQSPDRATSPVLAWEGGFSASPTHLPIPCFPQSSRPTSATSATLSERKRRTRRSSASSTSGQDEVDTVDLRGLDEIAREQPVYFIYERRPESAHGRVDPGLRAQQESSLSPKPDRVRASTAQGHRKQEESIKPRRDYGARSEPSSPTVHFSGFGDGIQQDSLRGNSSLFPSNRPKSASCGRAAYLQPSQSYMRSLAEPKPSTPGHRDRFAVSRGAPGPGAYTPVGFCNPGSHPNPPRTWFHDAVPMSQLHFHLKESAMKPEPATYNVTGDPGRSPAAMRCCPGRSTPSWVFGREARVCTIAGGFGFKSRHVQRRGDAIAYDDVRMTVWRDWM